MIEYLGGRHLMPIKLGIISFLVAFFANAKTLPMPDEKMSVLTAESDISGGFLAKQIGVFTAYKRSTFFLTMPFKDKENFRKTKITETKRIKFPEKFPSGLWVGAASFGDQIIVLDGAEVRLANYTFPEFEFKSGKTFAWDMIKPPADKNGEPTKLEIEKLRKKFKKEFFVAGEVKFAGITPAPVGWLGRKKTPWFFLSTRVTGSPLVTFRCETDDLSACVVVRKCYVEGARKLAASAVSGIGVSKKFREIVIGDSKRKKVVRFKFDSCFHIYKIGELDLPKKMKDLRSVYIDEHDRLWVTTSKPDDYLNASVFVWDAKVWR